MISVLAGIVMLLAMLTFGLGLVVVVFPLKRLRLSQRWHGGALMAGAFATFMIAGFGLGSAATPGPATGTDATSPPPVELPPRVSVALADKSITSAARFENAMVVTAKLNGDDGDPDYLFTVGLVLDEVAKAVQLGAEDLGDATELDLAVNANTIDRLGHSQDAHVITMTFDVSDLRQANLENLSIGRTLNLATDVRFGPLGARQIYAYCTSERGREQSRPFCNLADSRVPN